MQDNDRLLEVLNKADADRAALQTEHTSALASLRALPKRGGGGGGHAHALDPGARPWSASSAAGSEAGVNAGCTDALLAAARTALQRERAMRHQVRGPEYLRAKLI